MPLLSPPRRPALLALLPSLAVLSGCVATPRDPGPDPALVRQLAATAAAQVKRCYRKPKVASEVRQIVTRLRVRFTPDGQLAQLPEVIWQGSVTPSARPFAGKMAEAATLAVIRCVPVKLPPEAYSGGWEELEFTFSPGAMG